MVQKIIIICGPTAAGKTKIGCELAKKFDGEIVSADSQLVWRGFDVGTAKPSPQEMDEIPHHLIDVADPKEHFDAARFVKLADAAISDITNREHIPIVVGGTGMYIRMLLHGVCKAPARDEKYRTELEEEIEDIGLAALHERLAEIDPASANNISPNDHTRIVRALEIYHLTGRPASKLRHEHAFTEKRYHALKIGLRVSREELYNRINDRVDSMIDGGLIDEAKRLLDEYGQGIQPFSAVGYREILLHINGQMNLEEAIRLTKQNTRHLAKRQLTWFSVDSEIKWFSPDNFEAICQEVQAFV